MIDRQLNRGKGAVPMGDAINRSFISTHILLSAYFLTAQTYKHMRLITRVYGMIVQLYACIPIFLISKSPSFETIPGTSYVVQTSL